MSYRIWQSENNTKYAQFIFIHTAQFKCAVQMHILNMLSLHTLYHSPSSISLSCSQAFIQVNNYQEQRTIYDVIGTIYGQVEPDQMVILGNHRDAWVFGAVDPNSGTAVLQEMARAFGTLRTKGWRPGRSIVLCSWDAEEYGLIGSTEWVEVGGREACFLSLMAVYTHTYTYTFTHMPHTHTHTHRRGRR